MSERTPGVWEIVVQAGRDPITGKHRQISRTFRGSLREAKKARAEQIVEVGKGDGDSRRCDYGYPARRVVRSAMGP